MPRTSLLPVCLVALLASVSVAQAAGNVLLPSTGGTSNAVPNLGIAPAAPAQQTTTPAQSSPAEATQPQQTTATAPQQTSGNQAAADDAVTAAELQKLQQMLGNAQNASNNLEQLESTDEALKAGRLPTTIVDNTATDQLMAEAQQGGQYTLSLAISPKSTYGDASLNLLNERFGLNRAQVPSSCIMTVTGTVGTSQGSFPIPGAPSPRANVRYDGNVTALILEPTVYCAVKNLPRGAGYVVKSGNYFKLALDGTICTPPSQHPGQVTLLFNDIGNMQCIF